LSPEENTRTPPLTFEVREGIGVAFVTLKRIPEPPLAFGAREGMGVVIVAQKRIPELPTRI
jgi:hypothetical protein